MSTYSPNNEKNSSIASKYIRTRGRPSIKKDAEQNIIKATTPVKDNFTSEEDSDDSSDTDEEDVNNKILEKKLFMSKKVAPKPIIVSKRNTNRKTLNFFENIIFSVLIITVGILLYKFFYNINPQVSSERLTESLSELRTSVRNLQNTFHNQNPKIWNTILSQVEAVINTSEKIAIINLLGNESDTLNCLAETLSGVINKILHNNDKYLTLTPQNLGNNHATLIQKLKIDLQRRKTVLVKDLLNIKPEPILTFQYLCDRENPLVANVVYIITSILDDRLQNEAAFENHITRKYSNTINKDILSPLVTRIMDGPLIPIKSEPGVSKC